MGHIRVRKETNKLYFDFMYRNTRCREQTTLVDSPANRKKLHKMLEHIDAQILLNQFDYQQQFPQSKMVSKLKTKQSVVQDHLSSAPTFETFAKTWFNEVKVGWRRSYIKNVKSVIDKRLNPVFGEQYLDEITKAQLMQFRVTLSQEKQSNGELLSPGYINQHMKIMRAILTEGSDRYGFVTPYRNIKMLKLHKSDIEAFTIDEVNLILSAVDLHYKNYYTVRFFTGMRSGEIYGLKWRYVDFKQRMIVVRESWRNGQSEYTKNDSSQREIHMSQPVYDALLAQKQKTGQFEFVFTNRLGRPLDQTNVANRIWYPVLKKLGLRKRVQYQTRHTAATLWLASGENPEWIARQMGHSSTQIKGYYCVISCVKKADKFNLPYWVIQLSDSSATINVFCFNNHINTHHIKPFSLIHIEATVKEANGQHYINSAIVHPVDSAQQLAHFNLSLLPQAYCPKPELLRRFNRLVKHIHSAVLTQFLANVLADNVVSYRYLQCPASLRHHHHYSGGLLEHSIDVAEQLINQRVVNNKCSFTQKERDIAIVAALLHDIGKTRIFTTDGKRTSLGMMVDHDELTLEVCANALATLDKLDASSAMLLRHIWTCASPNARYGYQAITPIATALQIADKKSASNGNTFNLNNKIA